MKEKLVKNDNDNVLCKIFGQFKAIIAYYKNNIHDY